MARFELTGRPIAVTGASSGIGAATALACARAGMPVALGARRADRLADLVKTITGTGGRAIAVQMDVTRPEDCERLIAETVSAFGSIYSVYANAGYGVEESVERLSDRALRDIFETNFFGTMNTIRPALARMHQNPGPRRGHVLICSSCLGKMTVPYYSAYSATKAAQVHIARAMNLELRAKGIHVSSVMPISTHTEFTKRVGEVSGITSTASHIPEPFKQRAAFVADCTVACLRRPRPEVWTGVRGAFVRFGMSVCTLVPRLADWGVRSMIRPEDR